MRLVDASGELGFFAHDAHAASTATHGGLDDYRVSDFGGDFFCFSRGRNRVLGARQHRHAGGECKVSSGGLISEKLEEFRRGTDEYDSRLFAGAGESGVL